MKDLETKVIIADDLIECDGCGESYCKRFMYHIPSDDKWVCEDCLSDNYFTCEKCDKYTYNDCCVSVGDESWCDGCYDDYGFKCEECNGRFSRSQAHRVENVDICECCWSENTSTCEGCEEDFFSRHLDDCYYCESCSRDNYDNECEDEDRCNPPYHYYRLDDEPAPRLYYGIELETGTFDDELKDNWRCEILDEIPECLFYKSDCSIYDNGDVVTGVEIVSHPMTYKWLKANKNKWNRVLDLRKKGLRSYTTNSCGIHIHLTKSWFSENHLYKFMKMIYGYPGFSTMISQRKKNQLRSWGSLDDVENLKKKAKDKHWYKKYTAINLSNLHTIEIRIFRGTLNRTAFWKDIEYVQALVEFTKQAKVKDLKIKNFLWYVGYKRKEFPNLYTWLKKKNKIK